jgi:hypothetical protein
MQLEGRSEYALMRGNRPVPTMTEEALDEKCRNDLTWEKERKGIDGVPVIGVSIPTRPSLVVSV